jgi:hypothetical protein
MSTRSELANVAVANERWAMVSAGNELVSPAVANGGLAR